jgi:NAD(P)-dependent dehydrogenase (short-subunit alcohol dehydrogenase family)
MNLVLADVEEAALDLAAKELGEGGAQVLAVPTDVSQSAQVEALAAAARQRFGIVHVVCNNAGVGSEPAPVWEQSIESWKWVLGVNLWGVVHGIRSFVPIMLGQGSEGHVVNTASMAGHLTLPLTSVYHASKFAVVAISETLHHELTMAGAKVRASVLCPGFVRTSIMDSGRNRPPDLRTEERPMSEAERAQRAAYEQLVAAGLPPSAVADRVLEAIRAECFWVFPHPELLGAVRGRMETILAQGNPTLTLSGEMQAALRL